MSHWILHFDYTIHFYAVIHHQNRKVYDRIEKTISFLSSFITGVHCLNSVLSHVSLFSLSCFPFTCYMYPHEHNTEHAVICTAVMKIKNTAEKLYMHEFCHVLIFPKTLYLQCSSHIGEKKLK